MDACELWDSFSQHAFHPLSESRSGKRTTLTTTTHLDEDVCFLDVHQRDHSPMCCDCWVHLSLKDLTNSVRNLTLWWILRFLGFIWPYGVHFKPALVNPLHVVDCRTLKLAY